MAIVASYAELNAALFFSAMNTSSPIGYFDVSAYMIDGSRSRITRYFVTGA
jgi:hypothetical protein